MKKNRPWLVNGAVIALILLLTLGAWLLSENLPQKKIVVNAGPLGGYEPAAQAADDSPSPAAVIPSAIPTHGQGGNDP